MFLTKTDIETFTEFCNIYKLAYIEDTLILCVSEKYVVYREPKMEL